MLNKFPRRWQGMAIFSLACPDLTADQTPTQTLINHIDTHHGYKNEKHSATAKRAYIHTLFTFHTRHKHSTTAKQIFIHILFKFHTGELKRPAGPESFCQAQ
jgi:hypothetical protein